MRTTIRLADESRETLLTIAQQRGEKGVSRLVEEAVSFYLSERNKAAQAPDAAATAASAPAGRWQRLGADLDQRMGAESGVLAMVRAMVRGGLRRLPILRA